MNARELHSKYVEADIVALDGSREQFTILRALALLASVEESGDELVRALRDEVDLCRNETADDIANLLDQVVVVFVALRDLVEEEERVKAEVITENIDLHTHVARLETDRDEWKRRAEENARDAAIGSEINRAAELLPEGFELNICVERGAGWVMLFKDARELDGNYHGDDGLIGELRRAIDAAIAAKGEKS